MEMDARSRSMARHIRLREERERQEEADNSARKQRVKKRTFIFLESYTDASFYNNRTNFVRLFSTCFYEKLVQLGQFYLGLIRY